MRRLKKSIFLRFCTGLVAVLAVIRWTCPSVTGSAGQSEPQPLDTVPVEEPLQPIQSVQEPKKKVAQPIQEPKDTAAKPVSDPGFKKHRILGVHSYQDCFPDVQDVQIVAARRWGVKPVRNRAQAEKRKSELVYVGADPYFQIDSRMRSSIPYLVPRAHSLLRKIGHNFLDSLYVKGIPLHKILVSSVLRTEEDVARLRRFNGNATEQSCHRFGTTFDIPYNRYFTVSPPDGPQRRTVRDDTLKWVLSEVLRDLHDDNQCYIKYEVHQGCFHITVR